jgi:hypothetical protein
VTGVSSVTSSSIREIGDICYITVLACNNYLINQIQPQNIIKTDNYPTGSHL